VKKQLWKVGNVAHRLGVSTITIQRWIRKGYLKPHLVTPSGYHLFDPVEVERWIAAMKIQPGAG
jgi:DNA-binding transcriptional MerR regulator